jgi:DNA-binding SARP family transcriptional activator/tetratricopeptide (TPR) repeat protein
LAHIDNRRAAANLLAPHRQLRQVHFYKNKNPNRLQTIGVTDPSQKNDDTRVDELLDTLLDTLLEEFIPLRDEAHALIAKLPNKDAATKLIDVAEQVNALAAKSDDPFYQLKGQFYRAAALTGLRRHEEGIVKLKAVIALALRLGEREDEGKACLYMTIGLLEKGSYTEAKEYAERTLAIFRELNLYNAIPQVLNLLGSALMNLGNYTAASLLYSEALALCEALFESEDTTAEAKRIIHSTLSGTHLNFSLLYHDMGQYSSALEHAFKSLELAEKYGFRKDIIFMSIGNTNHFLGDEPAALEYFLKAERAFEDNHNPFHQAVALAELANTYRNLKKPASALPYFHKALSMHRTFSNRDGECYVLLNLSEAYREIGNIGESYRYINEARERALEAEDAVLKSGIEVAYIKHQHQYRTHPDVYRLATEALRVAQRTGQTQSESELHKLLAELLGQSGDRAAAQHHRQLARAIDSVLFNDDEKKKAESVKLQFEMDEAARKIRSFGLDSTLIDEAKLFLVATHAKKVPTTRLKPHIVVTTFGNFDVEIENRLITKDDWQRKKARDVFKALLLRYHQPVTIDELMDMFSGGSAKDAGSERSIQNAFSCIRKALEPTLTAQQSSRFLFYKDNSYTLDLGENAAVDFLTFKSHATAAAQTADTAEKIRLYQSAVGLYTGDFLKENLYDEWTAFERESLKDVYHESLKALIVLHQHTEPEQSLHYAEALLTSDKLSEFAYRFLITHFIGRGERTHAEKIYDRCTLAFKNDLKTAPPKHLRELLKQSP